MVSKGTHDENTDLIWSDLFKVKVRACVRVCIETKIL